MAVLRLGGPRSHRTLSEGTAAITDGTSVNTGLSSITGGAFGAVVNATVAYKVFAQSITIPSALVFNVINSVDASNTVGITVGYIFTGTFHG